MPADVERSTLNFSGILSRSSQPAIQLDILALVVASVHIGYTGMYRCTENGTICDLVVRKGRLNGYVFDPR